MQIRQSAPDHSPQMKTCPVDIKRFTVGDEAPDIRLHLLKRGLPAAIRPDDQGGIGNQFNETIAQTHG
jgi:hypothetical protein